jgi:hypothetical protein
LFGRERLEPIVFESPEMALEIAAVRFEMLEDTRLSAFRRP